MHKEKLTPPTPQGHNLSVSDKILSALVTRIETLEEEKKLIMEDVKEVYADAKAHEYNVNILRKCIAIRKRDKADVAEEAEMVSTYLFAMSDG